MPNNDEQWIFGNATDSPTYAVRCITRDGNMHYFGGDGTKRLNLDTAHEEARKLFETFEDYTEVEVVRLTSDPVLAAKKYTRS